MTQASRAFPFIILILFGLHGLSRLPVNTIRQSPKSQTATELNRFDRFSRHSEFWKRVMKIFVSYKKLQINLCLKKLSGKTSLKAVDKNLVSIDRQSTTTSNMLDTNDENTELWNQIHDINSERMFQLCIDLRGFYLKMGQFLGQFVCYTVRMINAFVAINNLIWISN